MEFFPFACGIARILDVAVSSKKFMAIHHSLALLLSVVFSSSLHNTKKIIAEWENSKLFSQLMSHRESRQADSCIKHFPSLPSNLPS
jgi:hypothetical protein